LPSGKHSAAASALGYQYQTDWCLLELLRRAPERPDAAISLELHDDVAWDEDGTPTELLQLKHHQITSRALTDKHDDLWSTFRVWMNAGAPTDPYGPTLTLVTTSTAAPSSAAAALRMDDGRDVSEALELLRIAARASDSEVTRDVRTRFLDLTEEEQLVFVSRIVVADTSPTVADVDAEIKLLLWAVLPAGHEETFLALLRRWWDGVALDLLRGLRSSVDVAQARAYISSLRDRFSDDNLPTLVELADVDQATVLADFRARPFVEQMHWVSYPLGNLRRAIVDYHRAVMQATAWLDQDLVELAELSRFRANLQDEWDRAFDDMLDDLGETTDEATKVALGKALLRRLIDSTAVNVRSRYNDPFFARGMRHDLADAGEIGWHPDFAQRLQKLLTSSA
jgi:hypothetical protein